MKLYAIRQYSFAEWEKVSNEQIDNGVYESEEDTMQIVWKDGAVCTDIMANGKRLVPILRKIENTLVAAGLAGDGESAILGGWFGAWADSLVDPRDKKYFCWAYDGKYDREQGHWSYSWGIEQIDEDRWYIFLNLATASNGVQEHLREVQEERRREAEKLAEVKTMDEHDEMENIHGDVAKIWYRGADAEMADNFPVLWEIVRDGEEDAPRKLHRSNYIHATQLLEGCGYIW